jgi:type IV pilus assembly protein PilV
MLIHSLRRPRGMTLVEVLVTIVILSFGLLALAGLQVTALGGGKNASNRSVATMLSYEILDAMRANRQPALNGNYNLALSETPGSGTALAEQDLLRWRTELARRLPAGTGSIQMGAGNIVTIVVQWDDTRGAGAPTQFQLQTRL